MHDEQKTLRQINAAVRLRTMQREKSELQLRSALQKTHIAEQSLQTEIKCYRHTLIQHQQFIGLGEMLDPAMQEQRQLALSASRQAVASRQQLLDDAHRLFREAKATLVSAKVSVDVADKAKQRVTSEIVYQSQAKELIDIFDAQYREGGSLGI